MRIAQVFVWRDDRPDDHDRVVSEVIPRQVLHKGVRFTLRGWDLRYSSGAARITDATYDEVAPHSRHRARHQRLATRRFGDSAGGGSELRQPRAPLHRSRGGS